MPSYAHIYQHTETHELQSQHRYTTQTTSSPAYQYDHTNKLSTSENVRISDPSKLHTFPTYYYPTSYSDAPNHPSSGAFTRSASVKQSNNKSHRAFEAAIKRHQDAPGSELGCDVELDGSKARVLQPVDTYSNTATQSYGAPQRIKSMPEVPSFAKKILLSPNAQLPRYAELTASPTVPNSQTYGNYAELKSPSLYRPSNQNDFAGGTLHLATTQQPEGPERSSNPSSNVRHQVGLRLEWTSNIEAERIPNNDDAQPHATMETRVAGQGQPKRVGRWTLAQLRQTDGIIPSQAGWNKGDSQKLMTNFGTPRNTSTRVKADNLAEIPEEILLRSHGEVRLQSGTNKFDSQRGMTGFGTGRDVCREGVHVNQLPQDIQPLPEEKIRLSDGIVRLQAGTNKYDSQKGMTGFGTSRRETTKMLDSKHPEYDHERPDQSEIPLQAGTNRFASQKGMTGFGTSRRETTRIVDSAHPEYDPESSIDATTIPSQMGSNKYASQKGMTGFGQPRWEVLDPSISWQNRKSQGMVRLQSGTNRFASQQGMTGFGTIRNTTYEAEAGELPYEDMKKSETIIPSQAGWNRGDSQKGMTGFGAPRDVKGKHLKRIWELEYPEEAEVSLDRL